MNIFNTLSGKKERLEITTGKELKLFVCGPTVYDSAHIGHARTYLAFDIIVRYLRSLKQDVNYLQNITDIDDKIIDRAAKEKISPEELAKQFENEYMKDMAALGVTQVTKYARATDHIKEIISQIEVLKEKGNAYEISNDGIYFDLSTFSEYGKLSHRTTLQAEDSVSRVDESVQKRNKGDFALWKFEKRGEPSWPSPWGKGRPGWHIEDTAITEHYFGPQYDIHGGGIDLKFPHHEAEIAQQEAASGKKPFVKIWMHTGSLLVDSQKMSKSLGNFITIKDFLKKHSPEVLRYIVLTHNYRSPIDYTEVLVTQAENALKNIREFVAKLRFVSILKKNDGLELNLKEDLEKEREGFHAAMQDDFNSAKAIGEHVLGVGYKYQDKTWNLKSVDAGELAKYLEIMFRIVAIEVKPEKIPDNILKLVQNREDLRTKKLFTESDVERKKIEVQGYTIEDTPLGPFIWLKNSS
ncbi:MAG: cysteine--tRNA ligase [bacterium]|nr:cysteine--tRNA ligase [bacterium]